MNIEQIIKLINRDMNNVHSNMHKKLKSKITLINKLIQHIISNKGKSIRPIIALLVAHALHYEKKQHITIASIIEFIHTATLLHDDVIDESHMRRGKTAANIIYGNAESILVGDFIYTKAFQMMIKLKSLRILSLMAHAVNKIAEGEVSQLMHYNENTTTIKNYMTIIYYKTARLFELASQASAILAHANIHQEKALRNYGKYIGIAFQLIDDVLDYNGSDKIFGKKIRTDLHSGKLTLPLLHAIHHSTPTEASLIRKAITQKKHHDLSNSILDIIHQHQSLEYTKKCASIKIEKAITCLKILSPSPYRQALEHLAYLVMHRYY